MMKPIELDHIEKFLKDRFAGKGALPIIAALTDHDKEVNFLSKALGAFALQVFAAIDTETAAKAITDGTKDRGIDAFHYSPAKHLLIVVQSKFIQRGSGQPDLKDVSPFPLGVPEVSNVVMIPESGIAVPLPQVQPPPNP